MDGIFQELSMYGDTPIRMLIGDFTKPQVNPWLEVCKKHAITCVQTMNFTNGKNSLDISLVIEGMKILYEKDFIDGIIIVASDSDYTPLAREWRNAGKDVIGIGRKNSTESYRASCNSFIYVENIYGNKEEDKASDSLTPTNKLEGVINSVLNDNNGKVLLSIVVSAIKKAYSDFDVRNYGYQKAIDFFKGEFNHVELVKEDQRTYSLQYVQGVKPEAKEEKKEAPKKNEKATKEEKPKKNNTGKKKPKLEAKTKNTIVSAFKSRKLNEIRLDDFEGIIAKKKINYQKLGFDSFRDLLALVPQLVVENDLVSLKKKPNPTNKPKKSIKEQANEELVTPEVEVISDESIDF